MKVTVTRGSRLHMMLLAANQGTRINDAPLQQPRPPIVAAETAPLYTPTPQRNNAKPESRECKRRRKQMERRSCSG